MVRLWRRGMSQAFKVRLTAIGPNRLPVLARIRPLLGLPSARCRSLAEAGGLVVARDLMRGEAEHLAAELRALGSTATVAICCGCGCSDGPDHFAEPIAAPDRG